MNWEKLWFLAEDMANHSDLTGSQRNKYPGLFLLLPSDLLLVLFPLSEPNRRPEGEETHWYNLHRSVSQDTKNVENCGEWNVGSNWGREMEVILNIYTYICILTKGTHTHTHTHIPQVHVYIVISAFSVCIFSFFFLSMSLHVLIFVENQTNEVWGHLCLQHCVVEAELFFEWRWHYNKYDPMHQFSLQMAYGLNYLHIRWSSPDISRPHHHRSMLLWEEIWNRS